ncbi:hypothetical protein FRC12_008281 [Ceratobasidium sp. 428]|nr:hypothetical protein FRC12_008281 [Ceratobasidium sp. 428]
MTTLVLSRDSAINSTLSYQGGRIAYTIETKLEWRAPVTVITAANGEELARLNRRIIHDDTVDISGRNMKLSEFMPQSKAFGSSNRFLKNKAGEEFEWKINRQLYCVATATDICVATFYRSCWGIIGDKRPAYIDISEQVVDDQDLIIVTWMIMENIRRWREAMLYGGGGWYLAVDPP